MSKPKLKLSDIVTQHNVIELTTLQREVDLLKEYRRLYKEQRELVRQKDVAIAKLKNRIEMLTKCNLGEK